MAEWIVRDGARYLAWLSANGDGFVVNTYLPPAAGYLILHRATCRTINRDLPEGRSWTRQYGKACAPTSGELAAWSIEQAGARPKSCGIYGGDGTVTAPSTPGARGTSRRIAASESATVTAPSFTGTSVRLELARMDGGPDLVLDGAQWLAEMFFRLDPSAFGDSSYDAWVMRSKENRFEEADIHALNRTMATHAQVARWAVLFTEGPSPILANLPSAWDLIEMPVDDPAAPDVAERVSDAISAMQGPYRQLATITKLLHLKRPGLVPVLDALVVDQIGGRGHTPQAMLQHLRDIGAANLTALISVQHHLATLTGWDDRPIERPLARIMDALLWSTHPVSVLYPRLGAWRATFTVTESSPR